MSTERPTCGLSSLLPGNCRGRAEAFARRLQSRLQTLGRPTDSEDCQLADENSWLAPKAVTTTQPRLSSSSDSDLYFDFDVEPMSPASPVDDPGELVINQKPHSRDPESGFMLSSNSPSPGSESSDGPYFDLENTDAACRANFTNRKCNGYINPLHKKNIANGFHRGGSASEDSVSFSSAQSSSIHTNDDDESSDVQRKNAVNESLNSSTSHESLSLCCIGSSTSGTSEDTDMSRSSVVNQPDSHNSPQEKSPNRSSSPQTGNDHSPLLSSVHEESEIDQLDCSKELPFSKVSSIQTVSDTNPELGRLHKEIVASELDVEKSSKLPSSNTSSSLQTENGSGSLLSSVNEESIANNQIDTHSSSQDTSSSLQVTDDGGTSQYSVNEINQINFTSSSQATLSNCCADHPDLEIDRSDCSLPSNVQEEIVDVLPDSQSSSQDTPSNKSSSSQEGNKNMETSFSPQHQCPEISKESLEVHVDESSSGDNNLPVPPTSGEHSNQSDTNVSIKNSKSYSSSFCRRSDLVIECPVEYSENQEVCDLLPVTNIGEEHPVDESSSSLINTSCSVDAKDSEDVDIKQLLKEGYLTDTGQPDAEEDTSVIKEKLDAVVPDEDTLDLSSANAEECSAVEETQEREKDETSDEVLSKNETKSSSYRSTDTDDDEDYATQRIRRCTSLKSGKTPPGTPGRKKIVRFADVLGLDLADVRTFLDEVPRIPSSAYSDLRNADLSLGSTAMPVIGSMDGQPVSVEPIKCLVPLFQQPGGQPDFLERVKERQVCLENAVVKDPVMFRIEGTVRVRNLDFHKSVHIRYTLDGWSSYADMQATYIANSCDGFSDKFSFVLYAHTLVVGQRLEFAVRFQCKGSQFWDSNQGANYCFQCLPPTSSTPYLPLSLSSPDDRWAAFY